MKGSKRLGSFEPETNDSCFRSKKSMAGSMFGMNSAAQPSQPQISSTPQLDSRRAVLSQQHVRALNTQFASWVQTQFQNHPDELWEDGVRDYLSHASNIMEKFTDVVKWLKANAEKGESSLIAESHSIPIWMPDTKSQELKTQPETAGFFQMNTTTSISQPEKTGFFQTITTPSISQPLKTGVFQINTTPSIPKLMSDTKSQEIKSQPEKISFFQMNTTPSVPKPMTDTKSEEIKLQPQKTGFFQMNTAPTFATSWSSTASTNSQSPFSFGIQTSAPMQNVASNDADEETEEQPSSPSVKKIEEKGITVVHEVKCKLYVKSTDPADNDAWKDKGMGNLSIKCREGFEKGAKESKPTIIVRNDVGRLLLNALIYPGIKTNLQKNSIVAIFHTAVDDGGNDGGNNSTAVARTFLIRIKTEEDRNKLATAIQEYAPSA